MDTKISDNSHVALRTYFCKALNEIFNPQITLYKYRSSRSEVFFVKGVLKICSTLTGEYPCRSVS